MADRLRVWGPAAGWAAVLFFLSSIPDLGVGGSLPINDKVMHFGLYAMLGAALGYGRSAGPSSVGHVLLISIGALYGFSDEVHQFYVPGRTFDLLDWGADVVGVVVGYGTTVRVLGRKNADAEPN